MSLPVDGSRVHIALRKALLSMGEERASRILENLRENGISFESDQFVIRQLQKPLSEIVGEATAKVLVVMVIDELKR